MLVEAVGKERLCRNLGLSNENISMCMNIIDELLTLLNQIAHIVETDVGYVAPSTVYLHPSEVPNSIAQSPVFRVIGYTYVDDRHHLLMNPIQLTTNIEGEVAKYVLAITLHSAATCPEKLDSELRKKLDKIVSLAREIYSEAGLFRNLTECATVVCLYSLLNELDAKIIFLIPYASLAEMLISLMKTKISYEYAMCCKDFVLLCISKYLKPIEDVLQKLLNSLRNILQS